jgi:RND family efflux transporter MFP subunit
MNMDSPSQHQRDMHQTPDTHVSTAESRAEKRTARLDVHERKSAPRTLKIVGIVVLIAALAAAVYGILIRRSSDEHLAAWTNQQAVPAVEVVHPTTSAVPQHLVLPGDVAAFYEAAIYARVSGYLKSWSQDIGARVHAGQLLATIETPDLDEELAQADADLATARANSALAELTAKRWHALISSNSVSVQSADEKQGDAVARRAIVAAQMAHVSRLQALEGFKRLVAPFDGIVTARNTDVGALINSGSNAPVPLFKVADMHEMRVYVRVPQAYASQLKTGMQATLTEPQYPGVTFPATLATTSVSVATDSRTVLTELMAPNPQGKLWAGTYAEVDFTLPADSNLLRVPSSALIFRSKGAQLATVTPDNVIAMKDVAIGRNLGTVIEIKSGIAEGDRVVATPLDTIEDGEKVSVTETPAPPANGAQAAD